MRFLRKLNNHEGQDSFMGDILLPIFTSLLLTLTIQCVDIFSLQMAAVWMSLYIIFLWIKIRKAQICKINKRTILKYFNKTSKFTSSTMIKGITIFLMLLILYITDSAENILFWPLFGCALIFGFGALILIRNKPVFLLTLWLLYIILYFIITSMFNLIFPIKIFFILSIIILPPTLSDFILLNRISKDQRYKNIIM
jgi:hypothetical protein